MPEQLPVTNAWPARSVAHASGAGMALPPVRVLFVTPYYKPSWGGIERVIAQLSACLLANGHTVGVLTAPYVFPRRYVPDLPAREVIDDAVQIFRLPSRPHRAPPFYSVPLVWFPPRAIAGALADFRPDVIHWVGDGWFLANFWTWWYGHHHASIVFTPSFHRLVPAYRWLQPLNIVLARLADRITTLSSVEERRLRQTYLVPGARVERIGWGTESAHADATPPRGWDPSMLTILCVGRLGDHKAQQWLVDRVLQVRRRLPRNKRLRLVLVGRDEGGERAVRRHIERNGARDLVLLTGEVDDAELRRWYAHADVFALFSHYEAFGLVFLEAMAYGTPVVTHAVGASAEGGIVVPAFDARAAETALERLLVDDAYRRVLGQAAAAYAAGFTWPAVTRRFVGVYRAARAGKRAWTAPERERVRA